MTMDQISQKASIIIITFNHSKYIKKCLNSVLQSNPLEILVFDNGSIDNTCSLVEEYPNVILFRSKENVGFGKANNFAFSHAKGDFVVFLNPDTFVKKEWLEKLLPPISESDHTISIPTIMMFDEETINTCGNFNHFTGLAFTNGMGRKLTDLSKIPRVAGISGACFATSKETFQILSGFDSRFFCYMEDVDLSWKALCRNIRIVWIKDSCVYHDYRMRLGPEKLFNLEKGRYIILKKYIGKKDAIILLPSLVCAELLTWGYCLTIGRKGLLSKIQATIEGLGASVDRIFPDNYGTLINRLDSEIPLSSTINSLDNIARRIANAIFKLNLRMFPR